ncbi:hypothetical protein [Cyclobacterium lianum]|nr:hypothetical protein [Cyclobacterium lianum]
MPTESEDLIPAAEILSSGEVSDMMGLIEEVDLLVLSAMQQDLTQYKIRPLLDASSCPGSSISRDEKNKLIRVDYGDGCVCNRGLEKKGAIVISYTDEFLFKGSEMSITFQDFSLNGHRMEGQRILKNLGYQVSSRSLRFSSDTENFQLVNVQGKKFSMQQRYVRDLQLSTEKTGFRIYLSGSGRLSTEKYLSTSFEIVKPIVYLQECMESAVPSPSEGSLQLFNQGDKKILVHFDAKACE